MQFERQIILVKLKGFVTGAVPKSEIYEWALFVAVSRDFEELAKQDPLAEKIVQFLIEINNEREKPLPLREVLQYFIDCLEGRKDFDQQKFDVLIGAETPGTAPAPPVSKAADQTALQKKKFTFPKFDLNVILKVYVIAFVVISVLLNLFAALSPQFLVRAGEIAPSSAESWRAALPHLCYGAVMLLALTLKVPRVVFYGIFFVAVLGMFFYWYVATDILLKNGRSLIYLLPLAPFVTLPPTAGFFLMLDRWFAEMPKPKRSE